MLLSWIKETLYLTFREEGLWKKCFVESVIHCELRYIQVYFCQLFLVWKISFVQKFSFFTLCSKYLLFYVFIFCFLSNLACEYWLVYNLLTLASFQCNTQWRQIHSGKVYWETSTIEFTNSITELQNRPF